ncbi:sigma-54-dependent Fis family transcriptional regulator [Hansschlegelia quercus]|nr:sigma-54-dependent Fis family transcriptional regulator [Hansschlegelia quercus]
MANTLGYAASRTAWNAASSAVAIPADGYDVAASWRRCVDRYRLDPLSGQQVMTLTGSELNQHREPFAEVLSFVEEEIYQVAEPLSAASFSVSFADMAGVILYYRSDRSLGNYHEVERAGTLWAEGVAGTNGVGTCVVERRPVQVFKDQHFFRDFAHLSCCAAPVMAPDGEMIGVLNFTTGNPDVSEGAFRLACGLVSKVAERLGNQLFRRQFRSNALLASFGASGSLLLAIDDEHNLVGANASARSWLQLSEGAFRQRKLWDFFDGDGAAALAGEAGRIRLRRNDEETEFSFQGRPGASVARAAAPKSLKPLKRADPVDLSAGPTVEACLGADPRMGGQLRLLRRVVGSRLPILVLGETGVGKDTLARALHREGDRRDKPFVAFNCAAVPESLIDSELFGYGSGAFTGARREGNPGRLADADGGTLFLDEIGDMPLALQTRLLRVLETGEVTPLGSGKPKQVDLQVIAATNHDVKTRIAEGAFRADLYHRLAAVVVTLPPLRERADAAALIRRLFMHARADRPLDLSSDALAALLSHPWPGNVRELRYVLQRAVLVADGPEVTVDDLMLDAARGPAQQAGPQNETADTARGAVALAERRVIEEALVANEGDVTRSARALKISRATLYRKLRQHQLDVPGRRH